MCAHTGISSFSFGFDGRVVGMPTSNWEGKLTIQANPSLLWLNVVGAAELFFVNVRSTETLTVN